MTTTSTVANEGDIDLNKRNGVEAVADLATRAAEWTDLTEDGRLKATVAPDGTTIVVDVQRKLDDYRTDAPVRKQGTFQVHEPVSFISYLEKHGLPQTEVWANLVECRIVGVINAHDAALNPAGFADHRVQFSVAQTEAWKAWLKYDDKLIGLEAFAEHIEDRLGEITNPEAADMMELAQTLHVNVGVSFTQSKRLSSGEREFSFREDVNGTAGRAGNIEVPEVFLIAVAPFEGSDPVEVKVRFRYQMREGRLQVGYKIVDRDAIVRSAFEDVVGVIADGVTHPVFYGTSA